MKDARQRSPSRSRKVVRVYKFCTNVGINLNDVHNITRASTLTSIRGQWFTGSKNGGGVHNSSRFPDRSAPTDLRGCGGARAGGGERGIPRRGDRDVAAIEHHFPLRDLRRGAWRILDGVRVFGAFWLV